MSLLSGLTLASPLAKDAPASADSSAAHEARPRRGKILRFPFFGTSDEEPERRPDAPESGRAPQDAFLNLAGHELRTPLTALRLHFDSLRHAAEDRPLTPHDQRLLERIARTDRQLHRLERTVEQLLVASRFASGTMQLAPAPVDLGELVSAVAGRWARDLAGSVDIDIQVHANARGLFDRAALELIVENLVSNAVKFGLGKPVVVELLAVRGRALLRVTDHGLGIAPADQARIFERFVQATPWKPCSGMGVGLWVSRQIAEASGGRLNVHSTPGQGSCFVLDLPLEQEVAS